MFEHFYASPLHHPILLWMAPLVFLIRVPLLGNSFRRALLVFTIFTLIDPLITGPVSAYGASQLGWSPAVVQNVMLVFVLLGDFRVFYLLERYRRPDRAEGLWLRAVGLTLVVPLLQLALIQALPANFAEPRHTFVAYELLFVCLALGYRSLVLGPPLGLPSSEAGSASTEAEELRPFLRSVLGFSITYYTLWAASDLVILSGSDLGYGLRLIPNVMYYGLFLPFVYLRAPGRLKSEEPVIARAGGTG